MTLLETSSFLAALFSMMNPIGGVGIFAGMTAEKSNGEAKSIAWTCAFAAAITLLVVIWAGSFVLQLFQITVDEIRAAGGLIVLLIGQHMLFNKEDHKTSNAETKNIQSEDNIAVVPLAIPLVAGPGTMATVLVAAQHHGGMIAKIQLSITAIAICIVTGILFSYAKPLASRLGKSGMAVISRVMGMILMAIAAGMIADGLKGMFPLLAQS